MLLNCAVMELHFQVFPESSNISDRAGRTPVLIIPGLFGSTTNWRSIARNLSETEQVIVVDQRNHGRSPRAESQSYPDMVQDLLEFCDHHDLDQVILCGHSMGGKVAMLFALTYPGRIEKLIVLDIAPVRYTHSHAGYIRALMALDLDTLKSRSEADKLLRDSIPDIGTRMFLLQSLVGSSGSYQWRLNLPVLLEFMDAILDFPQVRQSVPTCSLFVAGGLSDYVLERHHAQVLSLFPNTQFVAIPNAGHWLHAEKPKLVLETMQEFLRE